MEKEAWVNIYACRFCRGSRLHSCTGYKCREAVDRAEKYYDRKGRSRNVSENTGVQEITERSGRRRRSSGW